MNINKTPAVPIVGMAGAFWLGKEITEEKIGLLRKR